MDKDIWKTITVTKEDYIGDISVEGATVKCLKHIKRYNGCSMPEKVMRAILINALKGIHCKCDHLDIFQRESLYRIVKDMETDDPYLKQFIKECDEKFDFESSIEKI